MRICMCILSILIIGPAARAGIIYVDQSAVGENNGSSWQDAFTSLQSALKKASIVDEIWVAKGEYLPASTEQREATFSLSGGVRIYGGFAGHERRRNQRDWFGNITTLSGDIGHPGRHRDNTYRLIEAVDLQTQAILDGFVITGARNDRDGALGRGGAVYAERSSILIENCRIKRNTAFGGGGVWVESGTAILTDSVILNL